MNHVFGPVPSRRLGLSLGVDIIPFKTCSLSCIYCQIGRTRQTTLERHKYVTFEDIAPEIEVHLKKEPIPDWITISGSGEPTLNSNIGTIITGIKSLTDIPVCVITNGTLLWYPEVQTDISQADVVMPSLDCAREQAFIKVCRPHPDLNIRTIINGLCEFRKVYTGTIWLEILLVAGVNDYPEDLDALRSAVGEIKPDSVQLNTVVRPPAESFASPLTLERLEEIRAFFGGKAEIIASFSKETIKRETVEAHDIQEYLKRRPGSSDDISASLGAEKSIVESLLEDLKKAGKVKMDVFLGKSFWVYAGD